MTSTRSISLCAIFGRPAQLKETVLPTYADLLKHFLWVRNELLWKGNKKDPAVKDICEIVSCDIVRIWKRASIPVVSQQEIFRLIHKFNEKYKKIKKIPNSRKGADKARKDFYEHASNTLFDISACKCLNFDKCTCSSKSKIPKMERIFLTDQRNERKMAIGSMDFSASQKLKRKQERQLRLEVRQAKTRNLKHTISTTITDVETNSVLGSDSEDITEDDGDYVRREAKSLKKKFANLSSTSKPGQMRTSLPNLAIACDRAGVSDRAAAIIASSVLQDIGIVSKDSPTQVIDRSKVRRERRKVRSALKSISPGKQSLDSIYFDGRKDKTIMYQKKGNSSYRTTVVEEHVVLLSEPGSVYIGHVTPNSGSSADITQSITNFVTQKELDLSNLVAVGCDGTNINTGKNNGIIRRLEIFVGHKLYWFICLLHTNELPLRHIFQKIDGKTSGPQQFSGKIGKSLETCVSLPITDYVPIQVCLPEIDKKNLSTDQKYLLDISRAVSSGVLPPDLANRSPGKMAHSRWLTTANRILRLYVSTTEPPEDLKLLTEYVMKVYVPSWFEIKKKPVAAYGARHLYGMIQKCSFLPEEFRTFIYEVIQRNCYFAHSENILLAMLGDERRHIREIACRRILKHRKTNSSGEIRKYHLPKLNFDAKDYFEMIRWDNPLEPPATLSLSNENLIGVIESGKLFNVRKLPCHSQVVERHVRLVTEASLSACGAEARDGFIRSRIKSRNDLPKFDSKVNFLGPYVEPEDTSLLT